MNDNKINFKTPRTKVGTAMEIAVGALILIMWGIIIHLARTATLEVTKVLIIHGLYSTVLTIVMMVLCYFPKTFNIPKRNPRAEHYLITIELVRIIAILVMLNMMATAWISARPESRLALNMNFVCIGAILLVVVYYIIKIVRLK